MKFFYFALFLLPYSVFATTELESKVTDFAADILVPLKQQLIQTLQTEKQKNGVEGAVSACHLQAPEIAQKLQGKSGSFELGRASHRFRNPNNAPKDWMKPYFEAFVDQAVQPEVKVIKISENRYGYMEPIFLGMPLCLECHGTEIAAGTLKVIDDLYPTDKARGFKMGDFRGVFWVEVDQSLL